MEEQLESEVSGSRWLSHPDRSSQKTERSNLWEICRLRSSSPWPLKVSPHSGDLSCFQVKKGSCRRQPWGAESCHDSTLLSYAQNCIIFSQREPTPGHHSSVHIYSRGDMGTRLTKASDDSGTHQSSWQSPLPPSPSFPQSKQNLDSPGRRVLHVFCTI